MSNPPGPGEARGTRQCSRKDCGAEAVCVPSLVFYPPKSVMRFYKTKQPLTRAILDLPLCESCFAATTVGDLATPQTLAGFARAVETGGTACDASATVVGRVEFTDPDYMLLKRKPSPPASPERP